MNFLNKFHRKLSLKIMYVSIVPRSNMSIVYKKEKETDLHGDAGFTFGMGTLTPVKEDLPTDLGSFKRNPKYIPSLNLNYRTPKRNVFLQSEMLFQDNLPNNEFTRSWKNL